MATQNVDFAQDGATLDTGEKNADAIRPILDSEPALDSVFQRPSENLRTRTETLRDEVEALKYLSDADRVLTLHGGGDITWSGIGAGGTLTITADLVVRPFLAPLTSTKAKAIIRGLSFETALTGSVVPRAYSGANKISVQLTGSDGAAMAVAISGDPEDNIVITIDTTPVTGTTKSALVTFLTTHVNAQAYRDLGMTVAIDSGMGSDLINIDSTSWGASDSLQLAGAADAERHIITAAGLVAFFSDLDNAMEEGDVLCIWYDELVNGAYGGRRESMTDLPEDSANADGNLFLLRRFPERLPYAIPVATVADDKLRLIDGTVAPAAVTIGLDGGFVRSTGDTMTGALIMNGVNIEPLLDGTGAKLGTTAKRFVEVNAVTGYINTVSSTAGGVLGSTTTAARRFTGHLTDLTVYGADGVKPNATGLPLGSAAARFTAYLENATIYGTSGLLPSATGKLIGSSTARFTAHLENVTVYAGLLAPNGVDVNIGTAADPFDEIYGNNVNVVNVFASDGEFASSVTTVNLTVSNQALFQNNMVMVNDDVFTPGATGTGALGNVGARWGSAYINTVNVTSLVAATSVVPSADGGASLGTSLLYFGGARINTAYVDDLLPKDGTSKLGNNSAGAVWPEAWIEAIFPRTGGGNLGATASANRFGTIYSADSRFYLDLQTPTSEAQLLSRNQQNNIVARVRFNGTTIVGDHFNVLSVDDEGDGNYLITLDQAVDVDNALIPAPNMADGASVLGADSFLSAHAHFMTSTTIRMSLRAMTEVAGAVTVSAHTYGSLIIVGRPATLQT